MTTVTLYIPPGVDFARVNNRLQAYCEARGYQIVAVDRDRRPWWDTLTAAHDMGVDVILAADAAHVPADRTPRLEIADLSAARPDLAGRGGQDRPRKRRPGPV